MEFLQLAEFQRCRFVRHAGKRQTIVSEPICKAGSTKQLCRVPSAVPEAAKYPCARKRLVADLRTIFASSVLKPGSCAQGLSKRWSVAGRSGKSILLVPWSAMTPAKRAGGRARINLSRLGRKFSQRVERGKFPVCGEAGVPKLELALG